MNDVNRVWHGVVRVWQVLLGWQGGAESLRAWCDRIGGGLQYLRGLHKSKKEESEGGLQL